MAPVVEHVFLDRMNYVPAVRDLYAQHGLQEFLSDDFFRRQARILAEGFRSRGVRVNAGCAAQ